MWGISPLIVSKVSGKQLETDPFQVGAQKEIKSKPAEGALCPASPQPITDISLNEHGETDLRFDISPPPCHLLIILSCLSQHTHTHQ